MFSSKFPPQIGGVENVVYSLAKEFILRSHEVLVLTSLNLREQHVSKASKLFSGFRVSKKEEKLDGISVQKIFMSLPRSVFGFLSSPYRFTTSIWKIRRIIKKFKPDKINFHFPDDSLFYFYFSTIFLKNTIILNIHGNEIHLFSKNGVYKYFLNKILAKAKSVVVNSEYMREAFNEVYSTYANKVTVIRNGLDFEKFKKSEPIPYSNKSYYLFIGRFDYKKGLDILIKAFNQISKEVSRDLIIVGGPSGGTKEGAKSIDYFKSLVRGSNIKFVGRVPNDQVISYYKNAFYSVFPSRYEPFGIVALESMACQTPFIASSGGFNEIVKKTGGGVIFKTNSVKSLKNTLLRVDKDEHLREKLSKNGLKNVKYYNWKDISKEYLKLFS